MRPRPPKVPRPARAPRCESPTIEALGTDLAGLDRFWEETAAVTPLVEADPHDPDHVIVTFCWRDAEAAQVLLFVNRLTDETHLEDSLMRRRPGTDVWHLSYRMRPDWRASYAFLPHHRGSRPAWLDDSDQVAIRRSLDQGRQDPRNPVTCRNRAGVTQSVVSLPHAPPQPWLEPRPGTSSPAMTAEEGPGGRHVWFYAPPTSDVPSEEWVILVCFDGDVWVSTQSLPTTLDNLHADGQIPPTCAIMLSSGSVDQRWRDHDSDGSIESYVSDELLPWARQRHGLTDDPSRIAVAGQSLGGLSALRLGLHRPDIVGNVVSQSASLWSDDLAVEAVAESGVRFRLEVGTQEWVLAGPHRALVERLRDAGADAHLVEYNGGHDYACWRGGIADGLRDLFGA